jgi:glyoxylase-like metal-dependent hydrolase (beta-lactamase superfamily II)
MAAQLTEIADGVAVLPVSIANVYFAGKPGFPWMLIDTGMVGKARMIREAAEARFGPGARPVSIVLTHGHGDHSGNAAALADLWQVPIYAHRLEFPYLTGKSKYPPADPTAPGFMSFMTRFMGGETASLGERLRPLEEGKPAPGMEDWDWHFTPGHAPGHVAFFRTCDATLLAGDAFTTMNVDSLLDVVSKRQRISRPPTPINYDWRLVRESVRRLDALNPLTFACGHGVPMSGPDAADEFSWFVDHFPVPSHGRYVAEPAQTNENGVVYLPPAPPDRLPGIAGSVGVATLAAIMVAKAARKRVTSALPDPSGPARLQHPRQ